MTSQAISTFLARVVHVSSIQHGSQDVARQVFENVKLGKLLFLSLHQDTHAMTMSRGGARNPLCFSMVSRHPSSANIYIRVLEVVGLCHTFCY